MKSVRSSRRHGKRRGKFVFEIRQRLCGLCLTGKIVPEHCITILKATLQNSLPLEVRSVSSVDKFKASVITEFVTNWKYYYSFSCYSCIYLFYSFSEFDFFL